MENKAKGCVKLRRCSKHKSYYQVQFYQSHKNKLRKIRRHIRHHENDVVAQNNLARITLAPILSRV